eukprot:gene27625-30586_t
MFCGATCCSRSRTRVCSEFVGHTEAGKRAADARAAMQRAFEDAMVNDFEFFAASCPMLPDPNDRHVLAAALRAEASVIVTENRRDFPNEILLPLGLEARTSDEFIADTIDLEIEHAVAAVRSMRLRLRRPDLDPVELLKKMRQAGLEETAEALTPHTRAI